jgi:hypothetical protein
MPSTEDEWRNTYKTLRPHFRVIGINLPGNVMSDPVDLSDPTRALGAEITRILAGVIVQEGWERLVFVGQDKGSEIVGGLLLDPTLAGKFVGAHFVEDTLAGPIMCSPQNEEQGLCYSDGAVPKPIPENDGIQRAFVENQNGWGDCIMSRNWPYNETLFLHAHADCNIPINVDIPFLSFGAAGARNLPDVLTVEVQPQELMDQYYCHQPCSSLQATQNMRIFPTTLVTHGLDAHDNVHAAWTRKLLLDLRAAFGRGGSLRHIKKTMTCLDSTIPLVGFDKNIVHCVPEDVAWATSKDGYGRNFEVLYGGPAKGHFPEDNDWPWMVSQHLIANHGSE